MRLHTYLGGAFVKFVAIILMITGLLLFLYSTYISQQTGEPVELCWITSWIIFVVGLIVFTADVVVQRRVLRRIRNQREPSAI
jgi:divalent metal cation (Fe/Co/Zn/Cd) transporter